MSVKARIVALIQNMVAQVNADKRHRAFWTASQLYDFLIINVNALYAVGVIDDPELDSEEVYALFVEALKEAGLSETITLAEAQIGFDVAAAWPWLRDRGA